MGKSDIGNRAESHSKALRLLLDREIIGKDVTLNDLTRVSADLGEMIDPGELAAWTFVGPNYVYTGD